MRLVKDFLSNLSPFNNREDMPAVLYTIKKVLAFILIYFVSAIIGEAVVIAILTGMGYDPLHGDMPGFMAAWMLQYYGFICFILVTVLYCKVIEKQPVKAFFKGRVLDYLWGCLIAIVLLAVIICVSLISRSISFTGISANVSILSLLLYLFGFVIQSAAEEVMCRGFLLNSLKRRVNVPMAVIVSSAAFAVPHLSSILSCESKYAVVGIINLFLVSFIFSVLVIKRENIWISCGLHFAWNYVLNSIMGLAVSGSDNISEGPLAFKVNEGSLLNGGAYGIEASIITTVVLGVALVLISVIMKKKGGEKDGVQ